MSESIESKVVEKFRKSLSEEELSEDIRVVYRVAGGMPHERLEHEFTLTGIGKSDVRMGDELRAIAPSQLKTPGWRKWPILRPRWKPASRRAEAASTSSFSCQSFSSLWLWRY